MNKLIVALILLVFLYPISAIGAVYYVDGASGNDSNPGTPSLPWKTIGKANTTLQAGDTVYLRGGTYNISGSGINPSNTGTAGNMITYSAYNNETVTLVGTAASSRCVDLDSEYSSPVRSYIKITKINCSNFGRHLWIRKGSYNEISYSTFIGMYNNTPNEWRGSTIYRNATYNWIHHNTFGEYGNFSPNDNGVVFELGNEASATDGTSYNLIESNHFYHGGHHVIGMNGHHNVIRNNYIHNEAWSNYSGTDYGNRVFFMVGYDGDDERNLIEGNRIAYGSECADDEIGGSGGTLASRYNIIRGNMFYQNNIHGFVIKPYSGQGTANNNHIYSNVFWRNGWSTTGPPKNNWTWTLSHGLLINENQGAQDNRVKNNAFYGNRNYNNSTLPIVEDDSTLPDLQTISGNWMEQGDPKFTNISGTPDPMNETQFDFRLQSGSPLINIGEFLTTITSANGSGTQFQVADAGFFMDGWGIITGDQIQLQGQSQRATITSVDYNTNTITVNTSLIWTNGQGVSLAYEGSKPDIGAYEHQLKVPSPPRLILMN